MSKSIVAGGGLVGSLLSIILKQEGHEVLLLEKRDDFRQEELNAGRSINLIITAKGVKALKDIGLYEVVRTITVPVFGRVIHDLEGKQKYQAYGKDQSEYNLSVSRTQLNILLLNKAQELGVQLKFNSEVKKVDFENNQLKTQCNETLNFDFLFGTDGAGSQVRKDLMDHEKGICEVKWLGSDYKELLMPALNSSAVIEKNALHIWPRGSEFLMALPNLDSSFTMTLYMEEEKFNKIQTEDEIKKLFTKLYPNAIALMPNYIRDFKENPPGRLGTVYCDTWSNGKNVFLLGDAAHAIVPFFGQGMNLGFNDCSVIQSLLKTDQELKEFQGLQKENADAIAQMALENFIEMQESVGDPQFLNRKKVELEIEQSFPKLYRSRYALVTYTLVDYKHCQKIGQIQSSILDEVINEKSWDSERCLKLIEERLVPYYQDNQLNIEVYSY